MYNLPETVRESDLEKLSFAVQLAEGFYAASQVQQALPLSGMQVLQGMSPFTHNITTITQCWDQSNCLPREHERYPKRGPSGA